MTIRQLGYPPNVDSDAACIGSPAGPDPDPDEVINGMRAAVVRLRAQITQAANLYLAAALRPTRQPPPRSPSPDPQGAIGEAA